MASPSAAEAVDTSRLDRLWEKALTAAKSRRHALAASSYGRAAEEALRLHGETFVCTKITIMRSYQLMLQSQLEVVTADEREAISDGVWALVSSSLPLLLRRLDDNTMLPGWGTAVELAFYKRLVQQFLASDHIPRASCSSKVSVWATPPRL